MIIIPAPSPPVPTYQLKNVMTRNEKGKSIVDKARSELNLRSVLIQESTAEFELREERK